MVVTIFIVLLVAFALWMALGGPLPNLLPKKQRSQAILVAWMALRGYVHDAEMRKKLDELLPLLLRDADDAT